MDKNHKKLKKEIDTKKSPIEFFSKEKETIPSWLKDHQKGEKVQISQFFKSRVVYYPAAGTDYSPIYFFNKTHSAHSFVYVDYGFDKKKIEGALSENEIEGYHLCHQQEVSQCELLSSTPKYHLTEEEMRFAIEGYDMSIQPKEAFAFLRIYERDEGLGEEHGSWRFAILYIGADANATYDALFGNTEYVPYACVLTANMGSGCTSFLGNSLLELIAKRTNRFPKYLLCPRDYGWKEYQLLEINRVASHNDFFIWKRYDFKTMVDKLYEEIAKACR